MFDVCVVGSANLDLVAEVDRLPGPGETVPGHSYAEYPGGKGLNQAVAAARSGASTSFVGCVGRDAASAVVLDVMAGDGIDTSRVATVDKTGDARGGTREDGAAMTAVGLTALLPAYLWEMAQGRHINVYLGSLASLAYVGIFPSFLGYIFYNRGVAEVGASKASLFIHLMPVFGTLLSAIFLGEIPLWYHYLGISLIFSGIWLTMKK